MALARRPSRERWVEEMQRAQRVAYPAKEVGKRHFLEELSLLATAMTDDESIVRYSHQLWFTTESLLEVRWISRLASRLAGGVPILKQTDPDRYGQLLCVEAPVSQIDVRILPWVEMTRANQVVANHLLAVEFGSRAVQIRVGTPGWSYSEQRADDLFRWDRHHVAPELDNVALASLSLAISHLFADAQARAAGSSPPTLT